MASTQPAVSLSFEAIDDLIYSARVGDLQSLQTDIANLSHEHNCPAASIVGSAIDSEDENEGGTGACLLHWPAANGNIEILKYLLEILHNPAQPPPLINHRNHSGNTPLHWAALNTHLECVKALVEAGADVNIKNGAGHDAAFLAERSEWGTAAEADDTQENSDEATATAASSADGRPISKAMQVVECLLTYDRDTNQGQDADVGPSNGNGHDMEVNGANEAN
ncbi:ankyrin repeat containing protein [Coccidioides posadasii C735 delta SOWgp]|uniref:Ankyrin repeat containing protein n=1 Tax=Coccidioides posadasii (strain C735) TaxID=222929 RepID=C5P4U8_COCP7|nr:ankyrin repeat containing protein [Coccidioides posadasii C735 delta SOWgp]EER27738.1 ankyrin repeat containing protein [Coccidioides posadasii C735 delta SOWgp]|eukprot:XP_003069883.1 ankyrin repeat containing protein [Coccidioides posadasii C735 delta SOWgp]